MPRVRFENDDLDVQAAAGTTLSLVAFESDTTLSFGCRAGTCGTCLVRVIEGEDALDEPSFVEADTLTLCSGGMPGSRLACQLILGEGDVTIEW